MKSFRQLRTFLNEWEFTTLVRNVKIKTINYNNFFIVNGYTISILMHCLLLIVRNGIGMR